jgi:probable rRNA maturation factor
LAVLVKDAGVTKPAMNVEINVQDNFWETEIPRSPDKTIDLETWQNWLEIWCDRLEADLPQASGYELTLRLSDDAEIQHLNCQYRQQDKPTDVLSFAALEVNCPQPDELISEIPLYLGDIVISVETAQRQAEKQGHSLTTELAWLAAHGFLHLLGWDHPDEESLTEMLEQQEILLQAVGLTVFAPQDTYITDSSV